MKIVLRISLYTWVLFCGAFHAVRAQETVLKGTVRSNGIAVQAASILVHNDHYRQTRQTDSGGRFVFRDVPPGTYVVVASCIGFATAHRPVRIRRREAAFLPIELNIAEHDLGTVTVTHHRYKKEDDVIDVSRVANPVTIIDKKAIRAMGSRRLDEVMREQTGMAIVSDLGAGNRSIGLQMQGFSADYILVLLNGQPMTGRFNGNFDLSRISVSDVERIEIIKGASSSLYGSEALGGVVNIITKQDFPVPQLTASTLYGTYNTLDAGLEAEGPFARQRGGAYVSGNYYRTGGFNVNAQYLKYGQTSPPYDSYDFQGRFKYRLSEASTLQASARYANRHSVMDRSYDALPFRDRLRESDLNGSLSLNNNYSNGWRLLLRYYLTHYATDQSVHVVQTGHALQRNQFSQDVHRVEAQVAKDYLDQQLSLIGGAGGDYQQMDNTMAEGRNSMFNYFAYLQANYTPVEKLDLTLGGRYDANNIYGGQFNPSLGMQFRAAKWISFKASAGQGFKAPTYAQMYQVFTNIMQGYTVIGANNFAEKAAAMQEAGLIQQIWPNAANLKALQPETSSSLNFSVKLSFAGTAELNINGFYNNIRHLINTEQVGIMKNGQQLFSYLNIARTYTRGIEAGFRYSPVKGLRISAGYQFLQAKSRDIIDSIAQGAGAYGKVRSANGIRPAQANDYFGLPNRSKHMANLQLFYEYLPWGVTVSSRLSYRGKYGFLDIDNNGYIDTYDVFVKQYALLNAAIQKTLLNRKLTLRFSIDNMGNYTDYLMPSQPGRVIMGGLTWRFAGQARAANNEN